MARESKKVDLWVAILFNVATMAVTLIGGAWYLRGELETRMTRDEFEYRRSQDIQEINTRLAGFDNRIQFLIERLTESK